MVSSGILRRVTLIKTFVSEEFSAPFTKVIRIGELGTTLALTTDARWEEISIGQKPKEPHGGKSQKTPFFISELSYAQNIFYNSYHRLQL
jgi:hypothetical protein